MRPPAPIARWIAAPPSLRGSDQRRHVLRHVVCAMGATLHVVQAVVFFAVGMWGLAWLSVGSVVWFAACSAAVRAGFGTAAMVACWFEVTAHSQFLGTAFGVDTGYPLYAFAIGCGVFLVFDAEHRALRNVLMVLPVALVIPTLALGAPVDPWIPVSDATQRGLLAMNALGTFVALVGCVAWYARATAVAEAETEVERQRSERLLRNVLPGSIADRLRAADGVIADHHDAVTVLFADLVGFTTLSARLSTADVLDLLNGLFQRFDALADRHGLAKIKTIGDAYMVVGGLPEPLPDHTARVCDFAADLRAAVAEHARDTGQPLGVRIGIHVGPVVAGVIGARRLAYDLWGDTVNTASRMESHGETGKIHTTEAVRQVLGDRYRFEDRGEIEVKGKGRMRTWFVEPAPVDR